jgi:hypothetical protein
MCRFIRNIITKTKWRIMTTEEIQFQKVDAMMQNLVGRENHRHDAQTIRELFNLHNELFPATLEYSVSCGGCRQRVYGRVKQWWQDRGGKKN